MKEGSEGLPLRAGYAIMTTMNAAALLTGQASIGIRLCVRGLFLCFFISVLCIRSEASDFGDFPVSEDLTGIIKSYEAMSLEDRINELPGRVSDYVLKNPADPLGYYLLGVMDMDLQEFDKALSAFGTAIALAPEFSDAHAQSALALVYGRQVDPAAGATSTLTLAAAAAGRAVELSPGRPDFQSVAASVYLAQGEFEAAAGAMGHAVLLAPASVAYHQQLAALFLQTGHAFRASEELDLAIILDSDANPHAVSPRADLIDSLAPLQTAIRRAVTEPDEALNAVNQFLEKKQFSDAVTHSVELLKKFPNNPEVLYRSALSFWNAFQDMDSASVYLERALAETPLFASARELQCILIFRSALGQEGAQEDVLNEKQKECMAIVNLARKATLARNALSVVPDDPKRLLEVGSALVQLSRPDRAIPYLAAARILEPDNADIAAAFENARHAAGLNVPED